MKKILITAPLRQDIDIFQEYQKGLDALEVPEGYEVSRFFCGERLRRDHPVYPERGVYRGGYGRDL